MTVHVGERAIALGIVVSLFLLASVFLSWLAGPLLASAAVPNPFTLYILFWIGIVALVGMTGRFEYRRKRQAMV